MQMHRYAIAVIALALAPAAAAQTSLFSTEPATRLRNFLEDGEASVVQIASGDFDDDGRVDLVVRSDEGKVGVLLAHGERQAAQFLPLAVPATHIAVLTRDSGQDGIYVATATAVKLWDLGEGFGQETETPVLTQAVTRLHYAHQPGHMWGCMWIGLAASGQTPERVQGFIIHPATGAVLLPVSPIAVTGGLGATQVIDLGGDGLYEIALTTNSGCAVLDSTGAVLACSFRALTGSSMATDRLTRLDDTNGTPQQWIAWSESNGTAGRLHVLKDMSPTLISYTPAADAAIAGMHVNGDGRADLVLPGAAGQSLRILLAQSSGARYVPGTGEQSQPLPNGVALTSASKNMLAVDLERDADQDLVAVTSNVVVQWRNKAIKADGYWPNMQDSQSAVVPNGTDFTANLAFDPPEYGPYDRIRARVYRQGSNIGRLEREPEDVVELADRLMSTSTVSYSIALEADSGLRNLWYFECEMVKDATSTQPEIVYPSMVLGLTPDSSGFLHQALDPTSLTGLWVLPFVTYEITEGNGTHGSSTIPVIPRLPPPPPPPL